MDKTERIFRLHRILSGRRTPVALADLKERLECSRSTVYRAIDFLRDRLDAPIESEGEPPGFRYRPTADGRPYELPGLWFSAAELQALVTFRQLLSSLEPGLLEEHLAPITKRLDDLIQHKRLKLDEVPQRVRVLGWAGRRAGPAFGHVAAAVLQRRQLRFHYHSRSRNQHTERRACPQRIVHYRDNWYLDAWDHGKRALRTFSVDRISHAEELGEAARSIPEPELEQHLASAFGIFSGKANKLAILLFSPERARWVADERWHPEQVGQFLTDGRFELRVPYRDARELLMEILRHGADVEVAGPEELRVEVVRVLERALESYRDQPTVGW
jgi:predicted DNA-binding transcriptional regulator YafY